MRIRSAGDSLRPLVERAYELARSGKCDSIISLQLHLKAEGYQPSTIRAHFEGRSLRRVLSEMCRKAMGNTRSDRHE